MKLHGVGSSRSAGEAAPADAARLLTAFLWIVLVGFVVYLAVETWVDPPAFSRYLGQVGVATAILAVLMLAVRRGHVRAAGIACVVFAWAFYTANAYTGGGIRGSASIG